MSKININQLDRYMKDSLPKKEKIKRKKNSSIYNQEDNNKKE